MKNRFVILMVCSLLLSPTILFADDEASSSTQAQTIKTVKLSPKATESSAPKGEQQAQTVVKLSPKVKTSDRDFKQVPCDQLSQVLTQSQKEKQNLKRRKNQCVNSVNAFMKGR